MQDVEKVEMNSGSSVKRQRRRKRKLHGYYFLVLFLVLVIGTALSMTLLFNIKEIVIIGSSQYNNVDIIKTSGISRGDNLIRLDTGEARSKVLAEMLYLDDIKFRKKFADSLEVELFPSNEMAYVQCQGGYMLISEGWRILGVSEQPEKKGLLKINGFDPLTNEPKDTMRSSDPDKNELLKNIMTAMDKNGLTNITVIDISDKYDITLVYEGRINIMLGNSKDLEYKLKYAKHILKEELRDNKIGYLIYHDSLGYSYVSKEEYDMINRKISSGTNEAPATVTVTMPVTTAATVTEPAAVTSRSD